MVLEFISSRSCNIHPVTIIGIIRVLVIRRYRRDSHTVLIITRISDIGSVITGREYHNTASHRPGLVAILVKSGILHKIVNGSLVGLRSSPDISKFIPPAVLADYSSMVRPPFDCSYTVTSRHSLENLT